jgi:hypothetical protein
MKNTMNGLKSNLTTTHPQKILSNLIQDIHRRDVRNLSHILKFILLITFAVLMIENASARGGGAPNGCENGCNINEVVTIGYQWNGSMVLTFQNGATGWPSNVLSSGTRAGQAYNTANPIPPITVDEIITIGKQIVDPNNQDVTWYLEIAAEIAHWLNRRLPGFKKSWLAKLLDVLEDKIDEEENIINNYCDTKIAGAQSESHRRIRQLFVGVEAQIGNITFNDIEVDGGNSDKLVLVFKNGIGTYVYNSLDYGGITETEWINLRVGCVVQ